MSQIKWLGTCGGRGEELVQLDTEEAELQMSIINY